jgi:hypothetical protein
VVTPSTADKNQIGSVWQPGVEVPVFGGPGGQVVLSQPTAPGEYVVPVAYSPDGRTLAATVVAPGEDGTSVPSQSVELVTPSNRIPLVEPGVKVTFLGWVQNR